MSAPNVQPLHLLLLTCPGVSSHSNSSGSDLFPPVLPKFTWDVTHDIYAALTRLVTPTARYDALVLDPEVITQTVVAAIPLLQQYQRLPVWVLDQGQNSPAIDRALRAGATRIGEALTPTVQPRSAVLEEAPQTDVLPIIPPPKLPNHTDVISQKETSTAPPTRENFVTPAGIVTDSHEIPPAAHNSISNATPAPYDTASLEPLISAEEIRALLGP